MEPPARLGPATVHLTRWGAGRQNLKAHRDRTHLPVHARTINYVEQGQRLPCYSLGVTWYQVQRM